MRRKFAVLSLAFAWLCANGAIWDAAQVVAWAKMFAGYAQTLSVSAALEETFDAKFVDQEFDPRLGALGTTYRYLIVRYTVATGPMTAGTIFADIVTDIYDSTKFYGAGFKIDS